MGADSAALSPVQRGAGAEGEVEAGAWKGVQLQTPTATSQMHLLQHALLQMFHLTQHTTTQTSDSATVTLEEVAGGRMLGLVGGGAQHIQWTTQHHAHMLVPRDQKQIPTLSRATP